MAIRFDASTDYLSRTANLLDYNSPYTVCFWMRLSSLDGYYPHTWAICASATEEAGDYINSDFLGCGADGETLRVGAYALSSGSDALGSALSVDTWYFIAVRRNSATSLEVFLNGVLDATCTQDITGRLGVAGEYMGRFNGDGYAMNGLVGNYLSWDVARTDAEIRAQMHSFAPVTLDGIRHWRPMFPGASERLFEVLKGHSWTENGTLTDEVGPSIAISSTRYRLPANVTVGGGALTGSSSAAADASGVLSGAGALSGSSSATSSASGTLIGAGALSGASNGIGDASGTLVGSGALAGTGSSTSDASGVLTGAGALAGSSSGTGDASGVIAGAGALSGTSSAEGSASGTLANLPSGDGALSGSASATSSASGVLGGAGSLTGTASASGDGSGNLAGAGALAGTSSAIGTASGSVSGLVSLSGTASATSSASATVAGVGNLSGSADAVAAASAILAGVGALSALASALSSASGTLSDLNNPSLLIAQILFNPSATAFAIFNSDSPHFAKVNSR